MYGQLVIAEKTKKHDTVESLVDSFIDLIDSFHLFVDDRLQYNNTTIQDCSLDDIDDQDFQDKLNQDLLTREELRETLVAYDPCRLSIDLVSVENGIINKTTYTHQIASA